MNLPRQRPMTLDKRDEDASRMLAVKTVCVCEGRSSLRPRAHLDGGGTQDWVEGNSATGVDSTGVDGKDDKRQCRKSAQFSSSPVFCRAADSGRRRRTYFSVDGNGTACRPQIVQVVQAGTRLIFSNVTSRT